MVARAWRNLPYSVGRIFLTLRLRCSPEALKEAGQREEIVDSERAASCRHLDEDVGPSRIGPSHGQ
jgi:hypothetical protein